MKDLQTIDRDLLGLIDKVTWVSFDVFDTAVLRGIQKPTDVFDLVAESFRCSWGSLPFEYRAIRVASEHLARENAWHLKRCAETTLDEIYHRMMEDHGIPSRIAERLKRLEIDAEVNVCTRNEFIYSVYRRCIEAGKKVIFISDMYLPADITTRILLNVGYSQYHKLFLSSSLGVTKSTGSLFQYVIKDLCCESREILHIGDHYESDVTMAGKSGLVTFFYEKCAERALRRRDLRRTFFEAGQGGDTLLESMYAATIINKFCTNPGVGAASSESDFWYEFGYKNVGILFFGFTAWLLEHVIQDRVERVYFLSRDGYIAKAVYDLVSPLVEEAPSSAYMYASRRALNLPAMTELDEKTMNFLVSGTSTLNVAHFLERLGLDSGTHAEAIKEAGFSDSAEKVVTGRDYARLRRLFALIADHIKEKAVAERRHLVEYLESIGILDSKKVGFVDIGWHGTLQDSASKILRLAGKEIEIKGYYLGTFKSALELSEAGNDMKAYLCEFGRPGPLHDIVKLCVEIFEFIHTAPHGSLIAFEKRHGAVEPVFEKNDFESGKIEKARALQEGALAFVEDFAKCWKHFSFLKVPRELAIAPLHRVLGSPTYAEAVRLGDLEHAEGFGDVYVRRYIAKPPEFFEMLARPGRLASRYRQAFWKVGYRKRMHLLSRLLEKSG